MNISKNDITLFITELNNISKYNLSNYSEKSLTRRIVKILSDNNLTISSLIKRIKLDRSFLEKVVNDITVNTTEIFREPKIWKNIIRIIIPELSTKDRIKIWHAGCSSGEEVYSMLILLNEFNLLDKSYVIGTDLNQNVIEKAKAGIYRYKFNKVYIDNFNSVINNIYPENINLNEIQKKYFEINTITDEIKIKSFLKSKAVFEKHDIILNSKEFENFDLIICRNVLIYFNNDLQNEVFEKFHNSLSNEGFLVIGIHESMLGKVSSKFSEIGNIYKKICT